MRISPQKQPSTYKKSHVILLENKSAGNEVTDKEKKRERKHGKLCITGVPSCEKVMCHK
jgi:hypothetical protein